MAKTVAKPPRTFQDLILTCSGTGRTRLRDHPALRHGDGAGTFHTATFLRALGPEP